MISEMSVKSFFQTCLSRRVDAKTHNARCNQRCQHLARDQQQDRSRTQTWLSLLCIRCEVLVHYYVRNMFTKISPHSLNSLGVTT